MQLPILTEAQILGVKRPIVKGIADSFNTNDGLGRLTFGTKTTVQIYPSQSYETVFLYASGSQPMRVAIPFNCLFPNTAVIRHTYLSILYQYLRTIKSYHSIIQRLVLLKFFLSY